MIDIAGLIGYFVLATIHVAIPFLTGYRIACIDGVDFLTLIGIVFTLGELFEMVFYLINCEKKKL